VDDQMQMSRRKLLRLGATGTAFGAAVLALPRSAHADSPESVQVAEIYQLQAAFHQAKTTQDLDLMMSLWADNATFTNRSTGTTYVGFDSIKSFWEGSGSFTHHRFSLVPSYKTKIDVRGNEAFLYFECHDIGNFADGSFGAPPRQDDRERHLPRRDLAQRARQLALPEHDSRAELAALLRPLLLPIKIQSKRLDVTPTALEPVGDAPARRRASPQTCS
jgi:ketosteroid isomerase-like protein